MTDVIILGAGGTARDLLSWIPAFAAAERPWRCVGLLDDAPARRGTMVDGFPVLGPLAAAAGRTDVALIDALGGPRNFRRRDLILRSAGLDPARFLSLVHPSAVVAPEVELGPGCLIYPFAFIGAAARIGAHVTVLSHVAINHEADVGDFAILASHAAVAGRVHIGASAYIGMGACLIQDVTVGARAFVGMGSVVIRPVPAGATVAGSPARVIAGTDGSPE
ncbi:MAG TPA: acetyltransferase [Gemmatimonadales bacterium]|nr:acetyltransferase [Gemmatimonadales bacterium]